MSEAQQKTFRMDFPVKIDAVVTEEEDGRFSAHVPSLPGCVTEADDLDELRANLTEAATAWLEVREEMERGDRSGK